MRGPNVGTYVAEQFGGVTVAMPLTSKVVAAVAAIPLFVLGSILLPLAVYVMFPYYEHRDGLAYAVAGLQWIGLWYAFFIMRGRSVYRAEREAAHAVQRLEEQRDRKAAEAAEYDARHNRLRELAGLPPIQ